MVEVVVVVAVVVVTHPESVHEDKDRAYLSIAF